MAKQKPAEDCTQHVIMLCGKTRILVLQKQAEYLAKGIRISIPDAIIKIIHATCQE